MLRTSENFFIVEFVPPEIYRTYGDFSTRFIDPKMFNIAQFFRGLFGEIIINNWYHQGPYQYSGFRDPFCKTGSYLSSHKRGTAIDMKFTMVNPDEIREYVKKNEINFIDQGVTAIELNTLSWLHVSCENWNKDHITWIAC